MPSNDPDARFGFSVPASLTIEQQVIFCVGQLIAEWAITESVLRGLLVALTGGSSSQSAEFAEVSWLSQSNNKGRCDLFMRCTQVSQWPDAYKHEAFLILDRFKTISKSRNFYAHGAYEADPEDMSLKSISSHRLTLDDKVLATTTKLANKAMINELIQAIQQCGDINREIFGFLLFVQQQLKVQHPELPPLPDGYPNNPRFPLPQTE